ncbi:hypothetical protein CI105_02495 [Candidatus Izimaplasma bacterium ZiA1]|uniref:cobyrinate a,c-diamide synthase n=1 Tax=Candidatus Izimoplasma sp. ZiA1 TaxID=2024899 RepID=UPI000BAA7573|nr:hypothetical protein CI105_02495 [Candidatus Izimaplasma bacterium ZiA1]
MNSFIVAGTSSSVGKTTVTKSLLSIIKHAQAFKVGPDFIDPLHHKKITGKPSYNLDLFAYQEDKTKFIFNQYKSEVNIIEGVMGLYGGLNHELDNFSTAHLSRTLNLPVILVVNGEKKDSSLAAEILGYINYDKRVNIVGVIINNITKKQYDYHKDNIEKIGTKVFGYLPKLDVTIKERHLGLKLPEEIVEYDEFISNLSKVAKETIELDLLLSNTVDNNSYETKDYFKTIINCHKNKIIAVSKDKAFSFFYDLHIEMLKKSGAIIKYFSPIHDSLPEADLYFFSGGYPENHLEELVLNKKIFNQLKDTTKKIIAECGGFIFLSNGIEVKDTYYDLVGLYNIDTIFTNKLDMAHFGYLDIVTKDNHCIKGHEFHYSKTLNISEDYDYYNVLNKGYKTGYKNNNIIAGYPHIMWFSNIDYFKKIF